jgi:hypothetical protein
MKSKAIDHVTSNEEYVRQRIFDGELPIDAAAAELLRLERAQNDALRRRLSDLEARIRGEGTHA